MNLANYSDAQRNVIGQCHRKIDEFYDFVQNGDWAVSETNKKEGYVLSTAKSSRGFLSLKAEGTFKFSAMQVMCTLHDEALRP